jgi:hypothetical protein
MGFWDEISAVLAEVGRAHTADELIAAVRKGPDQTTGAGDAFFAGSGGDEQLIDALDGDQWTAHMKSVYWWTATSKVDGSTVEYIEGDVYRRA